MLYYSVSTFSQSSAFLFFVAILIHRYNGVISIYYLAPKNKRLVVLNKMELESKFYCSLEETRNFEFWSFSGDLLEVVSKMGFEFDIRRLNNIDLIFTFMVIFFLETPEIGLFDR